MGTEGGESPELLTCRGPMRHWSPQLFGYCNNEMKQFGRRYRPSTCSCYISIVTPLCAVLGSVVTEAWSAQSLGPRLQGTHSISAAVYRWNYVRCQDSIARRTQQQSPGVLVSLRTWMLFDLVPQQFATMLMSDAKKYQQMHVIDIGILSVRPPTMFPLLHLL